MNPKQTAPLLVTLAPLLAAAPPLLIGAAIGLGLIWLFSDDNKAVSAPAPAAPAPAAPAPTTPTPAKAPALPTPSITPAQATPPAPVTPAPAKHAPALSIQAKSDAPDQFTPQTKSTKKRITREDLADALEYGKRSMPLGEAVLAIQARGFGKTAAYKALSVQSKFGHLIESTPDGLVEWMG